MPFAEIRGKRIYYETHGDGETVLLLHHGFSSTYMWKDVYPRLVEAGYRVVAYDRRGYGQSDPGEDFTDYYESDDFCEDSVKDLAVLSEMLGMHSFKIVGQCEGGVIGVHYAARFPHQVQALAIASTMCFSTVTMTEFNRAKFPTPFNELEPKLREKLVQWHGPERAEPLYEMARTQGGAYGVGMFDLRPQLPFVTCPALVLYPDRSALFGVEQAVTIYRCLPKAELAIIPRCGHNTYDQRLEDYVRHVLGFFDRVRHESIVPDADYSMTCIAPAPPGS